MEFSHPQFPIDNPRLKYWSSAFELLFTPPHMSESLAEVIGVHLGDGCLSRTRSGRRTASIVAFTASPTEYWYYDKFVKPTIESNFGITGSLYLRKDNTTRYHISSKPLLDYLACLGIPVGKKRDAQIPKQVRQADQVVPFIRGLYHAEGSIYRRYSKRYNGHPKVYDNLLVVQIRMTLRTLMREVHQELSALGIRCNKLTEKAGVYTLRITSQEEIVRFMSIVKPRYKTQPHR